MEVEKVSESDNQKYIPDEKRWRIIGYWQCCQNQGETADFFDVSQSAVSKILAKWRSFGDIIDHQRVGRPSKLNEKMEEIVVDTIKQNKYSSAENIAQELNVSRQTAFTLMKNMGLQYSVPTPIPQLNESHITKRFNCSKKYKDMEVQNIVFTDESYFQIHRNKEGCWNFGDQPHFISQSQDRGCLMVWGGISWNSRTEICVKNSGFKFNSESNIDVLENYLVPYIDKLYLNSSQYRLRSKKLNILLLQDNAPCHRSEETKMFLKKNNIDTIEHPPNSPDLNAIQQVWAILKKRVERLSPKNIGDLEQLINQEWHNIPQQQIQNCIEHYQHRLNEVYELKGAFY